MKRIVGLSFVVVVGCSSVETGDGIPAGVLDEMRANVDFAAVERMLEIDGQQIAVKGGRIERYDDEGFVVTIPVFNAQTGEHDRFDWVSYEDVHETAPVVALREHQNEFDFPGLDPSCFLYCYPDGECVRVCNGGGTETDDGGGSGCGSYVSSDTCNLAGTASGMCLNGQTHYSYKRMNREKFQYGRRVSYKDTIYSCGLQAASSGCNTTCTP